MTGPTTSEHDPRRQTTAARGEGRRAGFKLALDARAKPIIRPTYPGATTTVQDLEPLAGAKAARDIELGARGAARDYIRQAREAEHSWTQIGEALGLVPNGDADQAGLSVAEAAYTYAAGNPYTDPAVRYGRTFTWRCRSCDYAISDRGLIAGPADDERGHADGCARLTAAAAEWDAGWEAEP